jgi:hypothetical protein
MAAPIVTVTWTIQDAKGKKSRVLCHFPISAVSNLGYGVLDNFVRTTATLIDTLILGRMTGAKTTIIHDLSAETLKPAPLPNADIEEGAIFPFLCAEGTQTKMRLPTFDEAFYVPGSREVITNPFSPLANPDVLAFTQRMIEGRTIGIVNVSPSSDRGLDIVLSLGGYDQFKASTFGRNRD